jgi:hypothetical protein
VPGVPEPAELARLVDLSEWPRTGDWSLRAALVRYAQPEPQRASAVLEVVRRIEWALQPQLQRLGKEGPAIWAAVAGDGEPPEGAGPLVALLREVQPLDQLGDVLAGWAADISTPRPDGEVDRVTASVTAALDGLGIGREERVRPTRADGRRGRGGDRPKPPAA